MPAKKILVVDDEEVTLQLLLKRLNAEGFKLLEARAGQEAVEKAKIFSPDLILMDLILPDIDGAEAIRIIRNDPFMKKMPVIFFSSMVQDVEEVSDKKNIRIGTVEYPTFAKPLDFPALLAAVREALKNIS